MMTAAFSGFIVGMGTYVAALEAASMTTQRSEVLSFTIMLGAAGIISALIGWAGIAGFVLGVAGTFVAASIVNWDLE